MITLKTLPQATQQEIFTQVATHLLTQMEVSADSSSYNSCVYRHRVSGKTLKCAAGCLIGDNEYNEDFEGEPWYVMVEKKHAPAHFSDFITVLQKVHDDYEPDKWRIQLENIASINSLQMPDAKV
jgi:hypothetical protein